MCGVQRPNKTSVTNITGNTITVDSPIATVSGIIRFNHLPSEIALGPSTGIKMKWRITTVTTNTTAINFMYILLNQPIWVGDTNTPLTALH
jgi:hypothetical protein